jgi:hypothetical protein
MAAWFRLGFDFGGNTAKHAPNRRRAMMLNKVAEFTVAAWGQQALT